MANANETKVFFLGAPNRRAPDPGSDHTDRQSTRARQLAVGWRLPAVGLRCPLMRRHHNAMRRFELTGQVTPIRSPPLVDLVGRVPGAPPEQPTGSQPTTSCRGPGATRPGEVSRAQKTKETTYYESSHRTRNSATSSLLMYGRSERSLSHRECLRDGAKTNADFGSDQERGQMV